MSDDDLERLLKIGMPIASVCAVGGMIVFLLAYKRDIDLGREVNGTTLFFLVAGELFLLGVLIFFIRFMRHRWGWFRKK